MTILLLFLLNKLHRMKSRDLTNLLLIYSPEPSLLWCHHPLMSPSCQIKRHWAPHLRLSMVCGQYSKFRANSVKILDSPKMFQCRAKTHKKLYLKIYIVVSCITIVLFFKIYLLEELDSLTMGETLHHDSVH